MKDNLFDIDKEFFVIDSDNLKNVTSKLYGYYVDVAGIFENDNYNQITFDTCQGRGCFVNVIVSDTYIKIYQDFSGSYGLYIYRNEDYFAVSNSFIKLLEYLKFERRLTLNKDYFNQFLSSNLESDAYSETGVNEISVLPRNVYLDIDLSTQKIDVKEISYDEGKVSLDTKEGLSILDQWFDFWIKTIRNIFEKTNYINIDLSGGYDSRLIFLLVLESGIDLNKIRVFSINDDKHTHAEDFKIATEISNFYGFELNKPFKNNRAVNYSFSDILNIEFYTKMGFHKEPYFVFGKVENKIYNLRGVSGEAIRAIRWDRPLDEFTDTLVDATRTRYPYYVCKQLFDSSLKIFSKGFERVKEKYTLDSNSNLIGHCYLWDTQCRTHGGKSSVSSFFGNSFNLVPLMDPLLLKLNLNTFDCKDNNLLMILIYVRYHRHLLDFPFEGKRYSLSSDTIEYAQKLSDTYPKTTLINSRTDLSYELKPTDSNVTNLLTNNFDNSAVKKDVLDNTLSNLFLSSDIKGTFTRFFPEEIYGFALKYLNNSTFFPLRHAYSIISVCKVIKDIECYRKFNQNLLQSLLYNDDCKDAFYKINSLNEFIYYEKDRYYKNLTARIDLKFLDCKDVEFDTLNSPSIFISKPGWFQNSGVGFVLQSTNKEIKVNFVVKQNCRMKIFLRSLDVKENGKKLVLWIDYLSFRFNDENVFSENKLITHDQPYVFETELKSKQNNCLEVIWKPDVSLIR